MVWFLKCKKMKITQTIQPCSAYVQGSTHRRTYAHFSLSAITSVIFPMPFAFPFAKNFHYQPLILSDVWAASLYPAGSFLWVLLSLQRIQYKSVMHGKKFII